MTTKLIEYQQSYTTSNYGEISLTSIIDVRDYSNVSIQIIQWPHLPISMTVGCTMGKISGSTLSQRVGQFPLGSSGVIHTFPVVGPEFSVTLTGGPANTAVPIQAWVFLK